MVDGRPKGRFDGTAPEPNPKLRSGHILGSVNVPFLNLIDPDTKTLKSKEGIKEGECQYGINCSVTPLVARKREGGRGETE